MNKEIMTENFPKITKEIKAQIQEAKRIPSRINTTHTCLHTNTSYTNYIQNVENQI